MNERTEKLFEALENLKEWPKEPTEADRARAWRERLGLDRSQLSELTGYSREAITDYERGVSRKRTWSNNPAVYEPRPIDRKIMQRYRLCCAGVAASLRGETFSWD